MTWLRFARGYSSAIISLDQELLSGSSIMAMVHDSSRTCPAKCNSDSHP